MTKELWHPDVEVTVELATKLITEQFTELNSFSKIRYLDSGWDNKVFLIDGKVIFRFPHRKVAEQLIVRESAILRNIQEKISLNIPSIKYLGQPTEDYPFVFHGYNLLPGVSGCRAQLGEIQRNESIEVIATFLKELHSIDGELAKDLGAQKQVFDRTELDRIIPELDKRMHAINQKHISLINEDHYQAEIDAVRSTILPKDQVVLVHGDLYCKHILFEKGKLSGVIDWGDVGINVKAIDLALLYSFYPQELHHKFFEIYGKVDEANLRFGRFLGIYSGLMLMVYAHDINDELLFKEAKDSLVRINCNLINNP